MKIVTLVGARPQFVKAAVLSRAIEAVSGLSETIIHSGQHSDYQMSELFFQELGIPLPGHFLGISGVSHGAMTGRMMEALEKVLLHEKPDWLLVFGDTNTTLAGAITAAKLHIPVAHVEAGLRSFNRKMPEEINRILVDHCSTLLFTPTEQSSNQLIKEGVAPAHIKQVGDVMVDALKYYTNKGNTALARLGIKEKGYALATVHRAENTDHPATLKEIFQGLQKVALHCPVVLPLHPRTRKALEQCGILEEVQKKLHLIDPVGYLEMLQLEKGARVILTDSGGIQKEAYVFQVPCLTLRQETEWVELLESGMNQLVPLTASEIEQAFVQCRPDQIVWKEGIYGNGDACKSIVHELVAYGT